MALAIDRRLIVQGDKLRLTPLEVEAVFIVKWKDFAGYVSSLSLHNADELEEYTDLLKLPGVVLFDDVGQGGFTPRVAAEFLGVLDARYENGYLTAATLQGPASEMFETAKKKGAEVYRAVNGALRRLAEEINGVPALEVQF